MYRPFRTLLSITGPLIALGSCNSSVAYADEAARKASLEQLRRITTKSPAWERWQEQSGELPPDFEAMPSRIDVPDPLVRNVDGKEKRITTPEAWAQHRETVKHELLHWIFGTVPPAPDTIEANVLDERSEQGCTIREVELRFGPDRKAHVWCQLMIPDGAGPFPVFLTQDNHRSWALIALQRGYLCCVYAGADTRDDTDSFLEAYPEYDWSRLTRRAWAGSRCIDYLLTLPQVDGAKIAITGHSRNGKQSLIASALDERIAAVISSSSGAGGSQPTRTCGEQQFAEGIEMITRNFPEWFHPRWRFFIGHEDRLPVDLHDLVSLSAPRACLVSVAINDSVESAWATEQMYRIVKPVYALYGAEDRFRILYRPGGHETWPTTIERYLDWCDLQFGRGHSEFPERLIYSHDWDQWRANSGVLVDVNAYPEQDSASTPATVEATRAAVREMLGEAPPKAVNPSHDYGKDVEHVQKLLKRDTPGTRLQKINLVVGEYINAYVYLPEHFDIEQTNEKIPAVLWLHPVSGSHGYVMGYCYGQQPFHEIARAGYAVFCCDHIGFGRRVEEAEGFYDRYPRWSLLGKMVRDAQSALDAIGALPYVDANKVWVAGYGLGAMIGLHLCALDERPAGLAAVSPPAPFRLTGHAAPGGVWRWSLRDMLVPRMGFFAGNEQRMPYDIASLAACIAPKPLCFVNAQLDWESPPALTEKTVAEALPAYKAAGAETALEQLVPEDYNHFGAVIQAAVIGWLAKQP